MKKRALGTRKARILLKRLAVARGQPVPSDEIAAAVWGGDLGPAQTMTATDVQTDQGRVANRLQTQRAIIAP